MPTPPFPTTTDLTIQNTATGQIDYLQFQGTNPVASKLLDYGIAGWNVVAQGYFNGPSHTDLVIQNQSTGAVDFLYLDGQGNLIGSALSATALPPIVGQGFFTGAAAGEVGPALVAQLADGELDMLGFNASGQLIASDAIADTLGFAPVVGTGQSFNNPELFANVGSGNNDSVVMQLADGSIDVVGFSGSFANASLSAQASLLLPGSAGLPPVQALNQEAFEGFSNESVAGSGSTEGVQLVSQLGNGAFDEIYADSGYGDPVNEGQIYASLQLAPSLSGWRAVDGGGVARELFPLV